MNVTTNIIADVLRPNVLPMIWAKAGDSNSRHLNITVAANGIAQAIPPAAVVSFNARRFDGQSKSFNGSVIDGTANITLPDWLLEIDGLADCSVTIKVDDAVLTTLDFQIYVQAAQTNNLEKTIYYATSMMVPGEYYLFIGNLPYSFTLTGTVPAGGVITFDPTNTSATVYQNESRTSIVESGIAVTQQATGTFLPATGYDTSDATATAADILVGTTAYTADGKVTGTYEPAVLIAKKITENGLYLAEEDDADGFSEVEVVTPVPTFMEKTITGNGTYQASDDHADGYSEVTVEVPIPVNKLPQVADKTVTEITAEDLTGCTKIGDYAFCDCAGLTSVTIPNSVTKIGDYAFYGCTGLTSVTIGSGVMKIGDYAFRDCKSLTSVTIPNSVTKIGSSMFYGCTGLTSITIPDSVTSIENYAFNGCKSLTSITIPDSVTSIGFFAFQNCTGLTSITIGNGVTSIGNRAFYGCSGLTSITIGNGVAGIGSYAFYNCTRLTSIIIPDSVTSIGSDAFENCTGLTSVTIGNGVAGIGSYAFYNCTRLTSVTIEATTPPVLENVNAFASTNNYQIYVPAESVEAYKAATNWSAIASRIQAIPG